MRLRFISLAALLLLPITVFGHSKAEQTTPGNNATVETVEVIEIRFGDPMRVTAISMKGPDGDVAIERETGLDPITEFRASPTTTMGSGVYQVDWRGLAADGHPMQGSFSFTVSE
jgi:methionine-rich copper-binding protein CopC